MNTQITDIIFDIDGTLIDEEVCLEAQASSVAWKFGSSKEVKHKVVETFFTINSEAALLESTNQSGYKNNLEWYMEELIRRFELSATREEINKLVNDWQTAYANCSNNPVLYVDAVSVLSKLKESGYKLHIASGKSLENRKRLLDKLGIFSYFDNIFAAETIGCQKQDIRFWNEVVANLSVATDSIVVVGNQKNDDIVHPGNLGTTTILVERGSLYKKDVTYTDVKPDHIVKSLPEIIPVVIHEPKKICVILQSVGVGTHMDYVLEMAKALKERDDFSVRLLLEKPSGEDFTNEKWIIKQKFSQPILRVVENFVLVLNECLKGTKIFYIHYSFVSAIIAGLITKVFGGKVFYWNAGMPWLYKRPKIVEWYQHFAYKCIDFLVTGTPALVSGYSSFYGLKESQIKVIPNWIDLKSLYPVTDKNLLREKLSLPKDVPILLFTHKLAKRKGAHLLVPIMLKILKQDCHLVVAGDGPLMNEIRSELEKHSLTDRVHLLGWVNRENIKVLYRAADIFILPSEEEGSPHSLIEAMAYGLPFVAFDVGGVVDTISPLTKKYLCQYGDVDTFARHVETLIQDKEEYKRIVSINADWVERFDKPQVLKQFVKLF